LLAEAACMLVKVAIDRVSKLMINSGINFLVFVVIYSTPKKYSFFAMSLPSFFLQKISFALNTYQLYDT
jgi:hypothetical protein